MKSLENLMLERGETKRIYFKAFFQTGKDVYKAELVFQFKFSSYNCMRKKQKKIKKKRGIECQQEKSGWNSRHFPYKKSRLDLFWNKKRELFFEHLSWKILT